MATNYKELARQARLKVLKMIHEAGTSHIASNFSIIDAAVVLYSNLKPQDEVVWSKGWVAATIYYFLAQQGKIPEADLDLFGKEQFKKCPSCQGKGCAHCEEGMVSDGILYLGLVETSTPGIWANGGSMGHGLPIACGMALAKKLKGEEGKIYCVMSDGEMNEGTTWESAMFAAHHKLDNLVVIVDKNKWQAMGKTEDVLNVNIAEAFFGFEWNVRECDGHNFKEVEKHINAQYIKKGTWWPEVIVAHTTKGKGVSFMEDHLLFHYKHIDKEDYEKAILELKSHT